MTSWVDLAGWTLVHFVWQGAAIAFLAGALLRLLRSSSPQARYGVACAALAMMLAAPALTVFTLSSAPRTTLSDSIHLLRSTQGTVVGLAVTPPWSSGSTGNNAAMPPTELKLPIGVDTETVFSTIVPFWLAGVVLLLSRLGAGCWRVRRIHAAARLEPVSRWQELADDLARRLGLRRRFSVVDSARVATPTLVGWLQPIVLLPVAALSGLTPRQVEAILAHELAHIRRHDFAVNLLQTLAETVLFYHPAVWWMSARMRAEREHCCDDVAVAVCGDAAEYAAALTELASWSIAHPPLAMAATRGPLISRVRRLLRLPAPPERAPRRTTVAVAVLLSAVLGMGALGAIIKAQPIAAGNRRDFGPPAINRLLGFNLFPGPVQVAGADPIDARPWGMTVGSDGTEFSMIGFTGRSVIRQAYGLGELPIVGVPAWVDNETFDLTAPVNLTVVNGMADPDQVQTAMQQMLEGQLGLVTHREVRPFPVYAMVRASPNGRLGPSLKNSTADCVASGGGARPNVDPAVVGPILHERRETVRFCGVDDNFFGVSGVRVTMAEIAREFHRYQNPLSLDREVVDRTNLKGAYDFELRFGFLPIAAIGHAHYRVGRLLAPFGFRNVFTALPEQLGLKLVETTIPREVLVIDQISRPRTTDIR